MQRYFGFAFVIACGSKPLPALPAPAAVAASAVEPEADAGTDAGTGAGTGDTERPTRSIPMSCATKDAAACVPDGAFVKRLCEGTFPDVALVLMGKDAPFTRMYMKSDVDGWNADGGASARARLFFDEEMLALRRRAPPANGIIVGAGAGWLVMRWDGNCYTLDDSELTPKRPPAPKHAPIPFRFYSERTKSALLERPKILAAYQRRGKECKGAVTGDVSRGCEQADAALSAVIVAEIRAGATVPTPERLP